MSPRFFLPSRPGRPLLGAFVAFAMIGPVAVAGADDHPPGPGGSTTGVETGALIAGVLGELGLDADHIPTFTGDLREGVDDRVDAMIVAGVVTLHQVESLEALVARGGFDDQVQQRVTESRTRRDAVRAAAPEREVLDPDGIDPEPPPPVSDYPTVDPVDPSLDPDPELPPTTKPGHSSAVPVDDGSSVSTPPPSDSELPDSEPLPPAPYPDSGGLPTDGPVLDSGPGAILGSHDEEPPLFDVDQPPTL